MAIAVSRETLGGISPEIVPGTSHEIVDSVQVSLDRASRAGTAQAWVSRSESLRSVRVFAESAAEDSRKTTTDPTPISASPAGKSP